MRRLVDDCDFPWGDWCDAVRDMLCLAHVPSCSVDSPHEVARLAWAAAFRVPCDDESARRNFYNGYDDELVDLVHSTFPFMSDYSCAWFIDRIYRYMGRTDVGVRQLQIDETCWMCDAPTVSYETEMKICSQITMGNVNAARTFASWLRACMLSEELQPIKTCARVLCHIDDQAQCQYEESAHAMCKHLAQCMFISSIGIRYTPVTISGSPAYSIHAFAKN